MSNATEIVIGGTATVSTLDNFAGTAGSPATNALSIQGISGGEAIPITMSAVTDGAQVSVTPTLTLTTYSPPSVIGGVLHFANILSSSFEAVLDNISILFKNSTQIYGFDLYIFTDDPTNGSYSDHSSPSWNPADAAGLVWGGTINSSTGVVGGASLGTVTMYNYAINKKIFGNSQSLWIIVVDPNFNFTPASTSDMVVTLTASW